jgi:hypothetical protein
MPAYDLAQIQHAEQALAEVTEQGLFALRCVGAFEFRAYAASVAEVWTFRAETATFKADARVEQAAAQEQRWLIARKLTTRV